MARVIHEDLFGIGQDGSLPFILVDGDYVPEVWHKLCLACYDAGIRERTPKHQEGFPLGIDACMSYRIRKPLEEPRLHRFGVCDTPEGLENYRLEVCFGIHDHWVVDATETFEQEKANEATWDYSYHQRLNREVSFDLRGERQRETQDQLMINKMIRDWKAKRRFGRDYMLHTWIPGIDNHSEDAPCLQCIQFRLLRDWTQDEQETFKLIWCFMFRSHDLFKAWPMNIYALSEYQRLWALRLSTELDINIIPGEMLGVSTSLHLYGSYFEGGMAEHLKIMRNSSWLESAWPREKYLPERDLHGIRRFISSQLDYEQKSGQKKAQPPTLIREGYDLDTFPYPPEWDW